MSTAGRSARLPRIGVSWVSPGDGATELLCRAVENAGAMAVPLRVEAATWTSDLRTLDGLVLSGGNAIDPRRYGQVNEGLCRTVIPRRDDLEHEAFAWCRAHGLPVLGVCRGLQFVNVACGGTMLQDVPITSVVHEATGDASAFHTITLVPGTRLAALAGDTSIERVNSRHHQGLRDEHVAAGLRISARAVDGVVEGIEADGDEFIVGIQFHPERTGEVPAFSGIFAALVARARTEATLNAPVAP
jgi:putative glutamine amidotransferase